MRKIQIHQKDFVLHSEFQKRIRSLHKLKRREKKEINKLKKVGLYNINLYFRGIVPLRKRSNDFS